MMRLVWASLALIAALTVAVIGVVAVARSARSLSAARASAWIGGGVLNDVYVRRGLALAAAGLLVAVVGRLFLPAHPVVSRHIPLAMIALGAFSVLRASLWRQQQSAPSRATLDAPPVQDRFERSPALSDPGASDELSASDTDLGEMISIWKAVGSVRFDGAGRTVRGGRIQVGLGDARVDLRRMATPPGEHTLTLRVGVGGLRLGLPLDVPARLEARVDLGDVRVGEKREDGVGCRLVHEDPRYVGADTRLLIQASVGLGDIRCF